MKKSLLPKAVAGLVVVLVAVGIAYACSALIDTRAPQPGFTYLPRKPPVVLPAGPVALTDITQKAGIRFEPNNGAFGLSWIPETLGSGVAFLDYDGDGYPDLFFVNARDWTEAEVKEYAKGPGQEHFVKRGHPLPRKKPYRKSTGALYHNNGNGTFTDVTSGSGLDIEMYGMGAATGDYDNDGRIDLLITALGRNYLFRNEFKGHSKGAFREVAAQTGVQSKRWFTSAAFVDYDKDGQLDLFACRYVVWSHSKEVPAMYYTAGEPPVEYKTYSGPNSYSPDVSALFRNKGRAGFEDVSKEAGIEAPLIYSAPSKPGSKAPKTKRKLTAKALSSNGLGVAVCDYNRDGWPDFMVANDFSANFLFRNNRNGTFAEVASQTGVAFSNNGSTRAGMGIDTIDLDGKGSEAIVVGNYTHQHMGFYELIARHGDDALYRDFAKERGLTKPSDVVVTFGCAFVDIDNDSRPDIFAVNGHVRDDVEINPNYDDYSIVTRTQRPLLLWNQGPGRSFKDIGFGNGKPQPEVVGRGLACADIDLDGDVDIVITCINAPPLVLRNDGGNKNKALRLVLEGTESNRSAIGTQVEAKIGKTILRRTVKSGSSYLSQSELPLTLGIGQAPRVDQLTILWPSGRRTLLKNLEANQNLTIREGQGIVRERKLATSPVVLQASKSSH